MTSVGAPGQQASGRLCSILDLDHPTAMDVSLQCMPVSCRTHNSCIYYRFTNILHHSAKTMCDLSLTCITTPEPYHLHVLPSTTYIPPITQSLWQCPSPTRSLPAMCRATRSGHGVGVARSVCHPALPCMQAVRKGGAHRLRAVHAGRGGRRSLGPLLSCRAFLRRSLFF